MAQPHNDPATYDFSAHIDPALQSQGPSGFGQQMGQGLFSASNDDFQIEGKSSQKDFAQVEDVRSFRRIDRIRISMLPESTLLMALEEETNAQQ